MIILGIETSCDETSVALISARNNKLKIIDNLVSSQIDIHQQYGGIVPNLAAREHLKNLPLLFNSLMQRNNLRRNAIDLLAVTQGPGLIPALLIGTSFAKSLAAVWNKPIVGVHHIAGHIYASFFEETRDSSIKFPVLALVVSGGHTQLILMKKHQSFKIIGETLDDAAGEAFDKTARILGLPFPGGPAISNAAEKSQAVDLASFNFSLPRPMINTDNLNFSFSGLKTAVYYLVSKNQAILKNEKAKNALASHFQQAVIDILINKTLKALKTVKAKTLILGGGVSANNQLRIQFKKAISQFKLRNKRYKIKLIFPKPQLSLDNAAMIAAAGYFQFKYDQHIKKKHRFQDDWENIEPNAQLKL